ncbi:hypothetical protein APSETT444_008294 [Aspergillus pseudonomiae]
MDEPTKELVLHLMEEDARGALGLMKGKGSADQVTDHELALTEWARELRHCACTFEDYRMAKSLARAVFDDGDALVAATEEENRAFGDRMTALQLGGLSKSTPDQLMGQNKAAMAGLTGLVGGFTTVSKQSRPADATEVRSSGFLGAESSKVAAARKCDSQTHLKCVALWDEERLFDRANQVAARNDENPRPAQQEVQRAAQELREQHNFQQAIPMNGEADKEGPKDVR